MSAVSTDLRISSGWRTALPVFLLLEAAILLLYRDTAAVMAGIWWRSETFAHCLLVLPISLWLVWRQRAVLAATPPNPAPWVLLPMAVVALAWLLADLVVVNAAEQFALVTLLVLAVPAVLGFEVMRVILFPLLFLYFGVPFGEFALPKLMQWTADFTVFALELSGVPVFREGQHFIIPSGSWSVIDECSGVRYLMASFMVGSLFAYLNYRSYKRRAIFMLVSLIVPILANWFRAYMIVMLAHLSGNKLAVGVDHILYGWVFFGLIVFVMFMVGARWSEAPAEPEARRRRDTGVVPRPVHAAALGAVLVAAAPHLALAALQRNEAAAGEPTLQMPARLADGWTTEGAQIVKWTPSFGNPSVEVREVYTGPAGTVGLNMAYVRGQSGERKVVGSHNVLVGMRDHDWNLPTNGSRQVTLNGEPTTIRTAEILGRQQGGGARRSRLVVWRLYWIDGRFIGSEVQAKIAGAVARLRGRGDEGAAIVLYADAGTVAESNAALEAFVAVNADVLGVLLGKTRDVR